MKNKLNKNENRNLIQYKSEKHPIISLYLRISPTYRELKTENNSLIHIIKNKLGIKNDFIKRKYVFNILGSKFVVSFFVVKFVIYARMENFVVK